MTEATPTLTPQEAEILAVLRAMPGPQTQERILRLLKSIAFYVEHPRCQGMLAEGFPCGTPTRTCDECHEIWDMLDRLEKQVPCK